MSNTLCIIYRTYFNVEVTSLKNCVRVKLTSYDLSLIALVYIPMERWSFYFVFVEHHF